MTISLTKKESWVVDIEGVEWNFTTEEEAQAFIDSWVDITLDDSSPYKIGTKWWWYYYEENKIIQVTIKSIKDEYSNYDLNHKYSVLHLEYLDKDGKVCIAKQDADDFPVEDLEGYIPTKEEVSINLEKVLKPRPEDFFRGGDAKVSDMVL